MKTKKERYEQFKQEQDIKFQLERIKAQKEANMLYNQGLLKGLGFWKAYLFPLFMKRDV